MKKVFLSAVLLAAALPFATHAETSGFYVGGGIGLYDAKFKDGEIGVLQETGTLETAQQKKNLSDSSWGASLFIGKLFEGNKIDWFVQGGVSIDTIKHTYEWKPSAQNVNITTDSLKTTVRRTGVLDLTAGVSKSFSNGLRASLNVGILLSRFNVKFAEDPVNAESRLEKTVYTWGIAPGVSIEKTVGPVSLGISYSYQMFEALKTDKADIINAPTVYSVQQKPYYHVAMITVKKTF
jgi:hypothetical protein